MSYENETTPGAKALGRYHLVRRIGRGGMGEVWLAEDPSLHRQVAIKTLPVQDREDQQAALRFTREARSIAALHHLHILPVHDYGKQEQPGGQEIIYIVMPYIAGGSLAQRIAASGSNTIPQHEAITYLTQAAEAIDFAHQHGIVHRDVKPENLLLRDDRWLFLADFGLAYSVQTGEQVTTRGVGFGTPDYMAPEQAQGHAEPTSDIYSLAVIAYQLFTGRLPFHGETSYATVVQHITMAPPAPRQFNPALSPATEIVLLRGLAKAPGERPSSAQMFVSDLQRTLVDASFAPTLLPGEERAPTLAARPGGADESIPYVKPHAKEIQRGPLLTRRNALIGGIALLAAGSGLGLWAATASKQTKQGIAQTPATGSPVPGSATNPIVLLGHNHTASPLVWSPQEQVLASAEWAEDGLVFLWDMQQILSEQTTPAPHKAKLAFYNIAHLLLAWSPDGKTLALGRSAGTFDQPATKIEFYTSDLSALAPGYDGHFLFLEEDFHGLTWLPGNLLVTVTSTGTVTVTATGSSDTSNYFLHVWEFGQTKKSLATFPITSDIFEDLVLVGSDILMRNVVVTLPATSTLAFGTDNGLLMGNFNTSTHPIQWNVEQARFLLDSTGYDNWIGVFTGQRGGNMFAAISSTLSSQNVTVWKSTDPNPYLTLQTGANPAPQLKTVAWSPAPTDTLIAAGGSDGIVYIWDTGRTTLPIKALKGLSAPIGDMAWSSDGAWLAVSYHDPQTSILVWHRQEVLHGY